MSSTAKASLATSLFSLAGIVSLLFFASIGPLVLPHAIIYAMLVLNTYFSIRFWSALQPQDIRQFLIDGVLVAAYVALALSMGKAEYFAIAALALFLLATCKYVLMRGRTPHGGLIARKIRIDALGALSCAVVVGGAFLGYAAEAAWLFALGFALANVYLLYLKPMYRM